MKFCSCVQKGGRESYMAGTLVNRKERRLAGESTNTGLEEEKEAIHAGSLFPFLL